MIIFLSISLSMCFGCSKETSHRDGSFEYPQHMFWLRNKKIELLTILVQKSIHYERKIAIIFLCIRLNMCFGCSKEPSHRDSSFEYLQHMFWLRNMKINLELFLPLEIHVIIVIIVCNMKLIVLCCAVDVQSVWTFSHLSLFL